MHGATQFPAASAFVFIWPISRLVERKIYDLFGTPCHLYSKLENFTDRSLNEVGMPTWE